MAATAQLHGVYDAEYMSANMVVANREIERLLQLCSLHTTLHISPAAPSLSRSAEETVTIVGQP